MSDSSQPHGPQHHRLPCPSLSSGVSSNSCPLCQWCHPNISSSVSSCPQSFPALRIDLNMISFRSSLCGISNLESKQVWMVSLKWSPSGHPISHRYIQQPNAVSFPLAHLGYESLIHASYILLSKLTTLSSTGYSHPTSLLWNFQGTQNLSELKLTHCNFSLKEILFKEILDISKILMNQHIHKYCSNIISPRKRNNENLKHFSCALMIFLMSSIRPG